MILGVLFTAVVFSNASRDYYTPNGSIEGEPIMVMSTIDNEFQTYNSCVTPDGMHHIKGTNIGRLLIFDISGDEGEDEFTNFDCALPTSCPIVRITDNSELIFAGGSWANTLNASSIYIINISTQKIDRVIGVPHQYFDISSDGRYITTQNQYLSSGIYWTSNGSNIMNLSKDYDLLKFSPDSEYLITYDKSGDGYFEIFKFPEMTSNFRMAGSANFTLCPNRSSTICWSSERRFVAINHASENAIKIIDTTTWKVIKELTTTHNKYYFTSVLFSPNGKYLAIGGSKLDGIGISLGLQIYNTTTWSLVFDDPYQIDYQEDLADMFVDMNGGAEIDNLDSQYPIYETMAWLPDGSVFLSIALYKGNIPYNPEAEISSSGNNNFIYLLAIITGSSILVIVCVYSLLFYLGPYVGPFYSKLKPNELQNQTTRRYILEYVLSHPGCDFSDIKRSMQSSYSNVYYHLSVLMREDLIFSKISGIRKRFYSSSYPKMTEMFPHEEHSGVHEKIFLLLLNEPGLTQKELATRLNISEATVSRYILDLLTENFIRREREGKVWKCYANPYVET